MTPLHQLTVLVLSQVHTHVPHAHPGGAEASSEAAEGPERVTLTHCFNWDLHWTHVWAISNLSYPLLSYCKNMHICGIHTTYPVHSVFVMGLNSRWLLALESWLTNLVILGELFNSVPQWLQMQNEDTISPSGRGAPYKINGIMHLCARIAFST